MHHINFKYNFLKVVQTIHGVVGVSYLFQMTQLSPRFHTCKGSTPRPRVYIRATAELFKMCGMVLCNLRKHVGQSVHGFKFETFKISSRSFMFKDGKSFKIPYNDAKHSSLRLHTSSCISTSGKINFGL